MDADTPTTVAALQAHCSALSNRSARVSLSLEKLVSRAGGHGLTDTVQELGGFIGDFVQEMDSLAVQLSDATALSGPTRQRLSQLLSAIEEVMISMTSVLEIALPRGNPTDSELRSIASTADLWKLFMQLLQTFLTLITMEDPDDADQILASTEADFDELESLTEQHRLAQTDLSGPDEEQVETETFQDKRKSVPPDYNTAMASSSGLSLPQTAGTDIKPSPSPTPSETFSPAETGPSSTVSKPKTKSKSKGFKSFFRHISSGFNSPEPLLDPLCRACAAGNVDQARGILAQGANPNGHNETGHTPVTSAIANNHLDTVKFLLDNGANVTTNGTSPPYTLLTAPSSASFEVTSQAAQSGKSPSPPSTKSLPPLFHAANTGNIPMTSHLLYRGADPGAENSFGTAHFVDATETAPLAAVALLLENGASPRAVTFFGRPVIISAVDRGDVELTRLLLEHGAKTTSTSASGNSLLGLAVNNRNLEMAALLVQRGADPNSDSALGGTPLSTAVSQRNLDMVNLLLSAGAKPGSGSAPRDSAAAEEGAEAGPGTTTSKGKDKDKPEKGAEGKEKASKKGGVSVSIGKKRNSPPLITALQKDFLAGTVALLKAGANPNTRDYTGRYALVLAVQQGKRDHAQALLEHGADVGVSGLTGSHLLMILLKQQPIRQPQDKRREDDEDDADTGAATIRQDENAEAFLRLLLAHGADPDNHTTNWSSVSGTPLGHCIKFDKPELVRAVVENGADPHRAVSEGKSGAGAGGSASAKASGAVEGGSSSATPAFSTPGAKDTPFMYAVTHGKAPSVKAMLDNGAVSRLRGVVTQAEMDILFDRVLEAAAANGDADVMAVLLDAGVGDVDRALGFAHATAHKGLVALLEARGGKGVGATSASVSGAGAGAAGGSTTLFDADAFQPIRMTDGEAMGGVEGHGGHDEAPPPYEDTPRQTQGLNVVAHKQE